jgi:hypothetical protein
MYKKTLILGILIILLTSLAFATEFKCKDNTTFKLRNGDMITNLSSYGSFPVSLKLNFFSENMAFFKIIDKQHLLRVINSTFSLIPGETYNRLKALIKLEKLNYLGWANKNNYVIVKIDGKC